MFGIRINKFDGKFLAIAYTVKIRDARYLNLCHKGDGRTFYMHLVVRKQLSVFFYYSWQE